MRWRTIRAGSVVLGGTVMVSSLFAQDIKLVPGLQEELEAAANDTVRAETLARICFNLINAEPDSAQAYGEKALALAQRLGPGKALGDAWNNLGWLDAQQGRLDSAEARLLRALAIFNGMGKPQDQAIPLSNLGWVAGKRGDQVGALKHFQHALRLSESVRDSASMAVLRYAIGTTYRQMNDLPAALENLRISLAMERAMGRPTYEGACLLAIANAVLVQGDTATALTHYKDAYAIFTEQRSWAQAGLVEENIANIHLAKRPLEALAHYGVAMALYDSVQADMDKAYVMLGMAEAKSGLKRWPDALADLEAGQRLAKSIGIINLVMDYEKALAELAGHRGDAPGAVAHFNRYLVLKDSLQGENTQRELARLRTAFETERKEKDNQLLRAENRAQHERIRQRNIQLLGLAALVVLALLAALLFRRNYRQKRHHAEVLEGLNARLSANNAEITEINSLLESRLLRSQMNPHFIYNALGSAVELNDAGRTPQATDYLRGFARLLRMILDHSVGGTVSIAEELEFLRQYLFLESKRVAALTYAVEADPDLIDDEAELPALVVQPFVENAVWHGLSDKQGDRSVRVNFTRNGAGIRCIIADNGVGRGRNGKSAGKADHRSLGMQLTEERLRLLSRRIGGSGSMTVEDLVDAEGRPLGTRVTLQLDGGHGLSFQHDQRVVGG